jgi:phosphatidylserine/phosphatidylglycerophosphate/cardiolipin synthase-like enzyme
MFEENLFGMDSGATAPYPPLTINGNQVEIYFSPDNGVTKQIVDLVGRAQDSIYFLAYSFTSDDIGAAIIRRAQEGVRVAGVMDADQVLSNQGTEYDKFMQAGLDVRKDGNEGLMHHKVIIIDQRIVITGSYNFTNSAETQNDENVVIIFSPVIAAKYLEEFQKVYKQAQP